MSLWFRLYIRWPACKHEIVWRWSNWDWHGDDRPRKKGLSISPEGKKVGEFSQSVTVFLPDNKNTINQWNIWLSLWLRGMEWIRWRVERRSHLRLMLAVHGWLSCNGLPQPSSLRARGIIAIATNQKKVLLNKKKVILIVRHWQFKWNHHQTAYGKSVQLLQSPLRAQVELMGSMHIRDLKQDMDGVSNLSREWCFILFYLFIFRWRSCNFFGCGSMVPTWDQNLEMEGGGGVTMAW